MASTEVSRPSSKRLSPKGSFKLSLPTHLFCGQCKATSSPPDSPTGAGASARSLSSSSTASASSSSTSSSRARDRTAELRKIFLHLDSDMDGRISARELGEFFAFTGDGGSSSLAPGPGLDYGDDQLQTMLGFDEFVRIVEESNKAGGEEEEQREDLRRAFEAFEAVKGSGRITPRGLQRVLGRLGDEPSVAECQAMIRAYDDDGDGELDFHDFRRMMTTQD